VRALYRKLAGDPDLAPEFETTLRELHRKRSELAHQVGLAALGERRRGRPSAEDVSHPCDQPIVAASPPADVDAEASAPMVEAPETDDMSSTSIAEEPSPSIDKVDAESPAVPVSVERPEDPREARREGRGLV
jgi:hypothetical protein